MTTQPKTIQLETSDAALSETRTSMALMETMALMKRRSTSAVDVAKALRFDPVISDQILTEVNSPFYGLPNKVEKLDQAIALLGFKRIRELLSGPVARTMYDKVEKSYVSMMNFKRHGIAVGCMAEELAKALKLDHVEEFYVAGTMHDIGKYFYIIRIPEHFEKMIVESEKENVPLYTVERRVLGIDHAIIGEMMADAYGLGDNVKAAVRYHHGLNEKERERLTTRETQMVDVVAYANLLAHGSAATGGAPGVRVDISKLPPAPGILDDADVHGVILRGENLFRERVKEIE